MILVPALAVVWVQHQNEVKAKNETMHAAILKERQETLQLQCQEIGEVCQKILLYSPDNQEANSLQCDDVLQYGTTCLYVTRPDPLLIAVSA
jgi:hypothetical protein